MGTVYEESVRQETDGQETSWRRLTVPASSEWSEELFIWACGRVHTDRAAGHNGIHVELYKYSAWAHNKLHTMLTQVWETGIFTESMVTGVATAHFKSGDYECYAR